MVYIGTSGYSYRDWVGPVYPPGCKAKDMLERYAQEFGFVEVNFTYYRLPTAETFRSMLRRTPPTFRFAVKAHQSMTHSRDAEDKDYDLFLSALVPICETGSLACVVAQFPYSFHANQANLGYLQSLRERLESVPLAVEFRNRHWVKKQVTSVLHRLEICQVAVDEPDLPGLVGPVAVATAPFSYVRFHGRNAAKWYGHREAYERYDYLYSEEELAEWVPRISKLASKTQDVYVSFNNHYGGQAVTNARDLRRLLKAAGLEVI